jgi:hypothetical protein
MAIVADIDFAQYAGFCTSIAVFGQAIRGASVAGIHISVIAGFVGFEQAVTAYRRGWILS